MDIRILPSNIANMIAAGEVVQRPSSVVKELMENALDAGADSVTVIIKDAGRTLIQVIDNGCGMSPEQADLCFERHATSKISSAEDLSRISTFGFRGEALASIVAVAEVTLKTRREEDEVGIQTEWADSQHLSSTEASVPKGSNFSVRNLFYNVPARRKFLKSDNVEFKHIVEEFVRVALTRPEVAFTLTHNSRDVHVLKKAKSLKFRIQDLLGKNSVDRLVDLGASTSIVEVSGFVARPDSARKTVADQYFFVNGRYFRSPYLHKAVMKAYEDMIADGATPSYFIYLTIDPEQVDVNIHPTKTEVKFENDSVIFQTIYACVREALGKNSFGASLDFDSGAGVDLPVFGTRYGDFRPEVSAPKLDVDEDYNPFDIPGINPGAPSPRLSGGEWSDAGRRFDFPTIPSEDNKEAPVSGYDYSRYVHGSENYGKLFEDRVLPAASVLQLQGKYLVSPVKSGLLVVNIRRAYERILYEKFLSVVSSSGHVSQTALFPVEVNVGVSSRLVFEEHMPLLSSLGFDIELQGEDGVVVKGVPDGYSCDPGQVESLVADILIALSDESSALPAIMESATAERFARLGASRCAPLSSPIESQKLLDSLFACSNSEYTSRGQKIMNIIPLDEIDKKF